MEHITITKVENVQLFKNPVSEQLSIDVTIYITATHLIFMEANGTETWVLHSHLDIIEKLPLDTRGSPLRLRCKNFKNLLLIIAYDGDCYTLYETLMRLSKPEEIKNLNGFDDNLQSFNCDEFQFCKEWCPIFNGKNYEGKNYYMISQQMLNFNDLEKYLITNSIILHVIVNIEDLYAFHYNPAAPPSSSDLKGQNNASLEQHYFGIEVKSTFSDSYCSLRLDGWSLFDLEAEYQRMGLPSDKWVLTYLNQNYQLCDTYPNALYVPAHTRPQTLVATSKFRSKSRLPVLTFLDKNGVSITRSSQPLSGFSARCMEDEEMLNNILSTSSKPFMYIVDTRPKINALANRAKGAGYENENFYSNVKFLFSPIENIHVIRNSLYKLIDACQSKHDTMSTFLTALQSSGWLKHIRAILTAATLVAQAVSEQGVNVLVHCSDGWDRTAQTCSLASLLIDPYYRTIHGYLALIEKDWLAFGHKFTDRCGHLKIDRKEVSPVFLQFLDCTWQLTQQFSTQFQFNQTFLNTLIDHVYSCQYGTFIGNCQKDRQDLKLSTRTHSLWTHMFSNLSSYTNPLYKRDQDDSQQSYLKPNLCSQNIKVWLAAYARFDSHMQPKVELSEIVLSTKYRLASLRDHLKFLEKKFANMAGTTKNTFQISPTTAAIDIQTAHSPDQHNDTLPHNGAPLKPFQREEENVLTNLSDSYHPLDPDLPSNHTKDRNPCPMAQSMISPDKLSHFGSSDILTIDSGYEGSKHNTSSVTSANFKRSSSTIDKMVKSQSSSLIKELPNYSTVANPLPRLKFTAQDVEFIALRWQCTVESSHCTLCSQLFEDNATFQKLNCWRCGRIICNKCVSRTTLPGHLCLKNAPTCLPCHKLVNRRNIH